MHGTMNLKFIVRFEWTSITTYGKKLSNTGQTRVEDYGLVCLNMKAARFSKTLWQIKSRHWGGTIRNMVTFAGTAVRISNLTLKKSPNDCYEGPYSNRHLLWCGPSSVVGIATGYGLGGPGIESRWGARLSVPVQTGPGAHPASCTMGTGSFPGVKSGRGVTLTPNPLLVPWSWKGRAIPLRPLWAVRPVQSLSACTSVHFTHFFICFDIKRSKSGGFWTVILKFVFLCCPSL